MTDRQLRYINRLTVFVRKLTPVPSISISHITGKVQSPPTARRRPHWQNITIIVTTAGMLIFLMEAHTDPLSNSSSVSILSPFSHFPYFPPFCQLRGGFKKSYCPCFEWKLIFACSSLPGSKSGYCPFSSTAFLSASPRVSTITSSKKLPFSV